MSIELLNISKSFGSFSVLKDVSLRIPTGELVALLGPSGSGKTTLLRLIAGLEGADEGQILFNGADNTNRHVRERQVGFVFQHYALFRHMTIFDNIAFGLQVRPRKERPGKKEIEERVHTLLKLVQLEGLASRYPSQLSGGQRQRVALARALAVEPKFLLLDEPFGALDAKVRQELRRWLRHLHEKLKLTIVFVTHDQEEALELADRVVVMNEGKIEQIGTPDWIYNQPANPFVYSFLGRVNLFRGRIQQGKVKLGAAEFRTAAEFETDNVPAVGYVRPHEIDVSRFPTESGSVQAVVRHIYSLGSIIRLDLERLDTGELFEVELSNNHFVELCLKPGEKIFVNLRNIKVFLEEKNRQSVPLMPLYTLGSISADA